jgi:hypothetical protein
VFESTHSGHLLVTKQPLLAKAPKCRTVTVYTFRGDRGAFGVGVRRALDDQRDGLGNGPTTTDCLLWAGHTGVSTDSDKTIYGFNPDIGKTPIWQAMQHLLSGDAFPGIVRDDTPVFQAAKGLKLKILTFGVILPDLDFQDFEQKLIAERAKSHYFYGFPNGDGNCNCTTWLERLALPLLSGKMDEFTGLPGFRDYPTRRFGRCTP